MTYFDHYSLAQCKMVMGHFYRPQRSCGQGYVFTRVCDSVHWGGLCQCMLGYHPPPKEGGTPPGGMHPQEGGTPLGRRHPPGGMHPPWKGGTPPGKHAPPQHTVNERPLRILLECILVSKNVTCKPSKE